MKALKILAIIILLLALSAVVVYYRLPGYAKTALKSGGPRIDDFSVFDQRLIANGEPKPWQLSPYYNQYQMEPAETDTFVQNGTVAFLVIKDGMILHEEYWDNYTSTSKVNPFSVSKGMVGLAIGAALNDGSIKSLDEPVSHYLPEFKLNGRDKITIKDVLTMSSGLNITGSRKEMLMMAARAYYGTDLKKMTNELNATEPSGKRFSYQNHNTEILAMIIKKATGKNLADYISEKFWQKMGAEQPASWSLDSTNGLEKAYCCFNTSARDMARWGQLINNSGIWNGDTLVPPMYLAQAIKPDTFLMARDSSPVDFYGYHFWIINHKGFSIPYSRGIAGQFLFAIPEKNAVVVRFGTKHGMGRAGNHPAAAYFYLRQAFKIIDQAEKPKPIP